MRCLKHLKLQGTKKGPSSGPKFRNPHVGTLAIGNMRNIEEY